MNYSIKYKVTTAALALSLVVGGLSLTPAPAAYAAEVSAINQVAEVTWGVNLRTGSNTSSSIIRMIPRGENVTVIGFASNGWLQVRDERGNTGYISNGSKYTEVVGNSSNTSSSSSNTSNSVNANSTLGVGTIKKGVSFRTGPSTSNTRMRYLQAGEQVSVLSKTGNWYQVTDSRGVTGYVSSQSQYITVSGTGTIIDGSTGGNTGSSNNSNNSNNTTDQSSSTLGVGTIKKGVSFRTGPSTSNTRMRYLQAGEQVTVLERTGSWYKVTDSNGTTGYVSSQSQYISVSGTGSVGSNTGSTGSNNSGSSNSGSSNAPATNTSSSVEKVIAAGMKYLGTPYEFGSNRSSTRTFDCSAFVRRAFIDALGITLPGDSRKQGAYVKELGNAKTSISQLQRGDLMFFMSYKGTSRSSYSGVNKSTERITHVGIYLGDGKILHTYSNDSGGVRTDTVTGKHWEYRFLYGGSALK